MRKAVIAAALGLCAVGILTAAKVPPVPVTDPAGYVSRTQNYHPQVSPAVAALQAREQAAFNRGDVAAARGLERQVQDELIREQGVTPHPDQPVAAKVLRTGGSFAPDELIYLGPVSTSSADYDTSGTMWAAFASASDSFTWVFKSTDRGVSWHAVAAWYWPPKHIATKIEMVVGEGDSNFVYVFENTPFNDGDLKVGRVNKDGSGLAGWDVRTGADTITDFTACRDYSGSDYWLYAVAYNGEEGGQYPAAVVMRCEDYGHTWTVTDNMFNMDKPRLAFGESQFGYASYVPNQMEWHGIVGTGVTTDWAGPGTWRWHDYSRDTFWINDAAIAPAFTTPVDNATVWIAYTHNYEGSSDWDVFSAWSPDSSLTWTGPDTIAYTSDIEGYVDLRNYISSGNNYVNASYVDISAGPDAWLGYSNSGAPGAWTGLGNPWVNQSVTSGWGFTTFPRIVYSPGGPGNGGGLIFTSDGLSSINGYFNAPWYSGAVAENRSHPAMPAGVLRVTPTVARGPVRVSWTGSATRLTVTDMLGRTVRSVSSPAGSSFVWDGRVAAGTYLVRVTTNTGSATTPVVIE